MLKKEQKQFKAKLTVDRFNWITKQFQINVLCFFTGKVMVVLTLKIVCFLKKQWLIEIFPNFSFTLVNLLLSVSNEKIFSLHLRPVELFSSILAVLSVKLWFSIFDTTSFHKFFRRWPTFNVFFLVLSHYHINDSSHTTLLAFKKGAIEHRKVFKGVEYGFNGFDTPFSKNSFELFTFFCKSPLNL